MWCKGALPELLTSANQGLTNLGTCMEGKLDSITCLQMLRSSTTSVPRLLTLCLTWLMQCCTNPEVLQVVNLQVVSSTRLPLLADRMYSLKAQQGCVILDVLHRGLQSKKGIDCWLLGCCISCQVCNCICLDKQAHQM